MSISKKRNEPTSLVESQDEDEDNFAKLTRKELEAADLSSKLLQKRKAACCDIGFWVNEFFIRFGADYDARDEEPLTDDTLIEVMGTRKRSKPPAGQAQGGGGDNALCATQRGTLKRFMRWKEIKLKIYFRFFIFREEPVLYFFQLTLSLF